VVEPKEQVVFPPSPPTSGAEPLAVPNPAAPTLIVMLSVKASTYPSPLITLPLLPSAPPLPPLPPSPPAQDSSEPASRLEMIEELVFPPATPSAPPYPP